MTAAEQLELKRRAWHVIKAPIPAVVRNGDSRVAAEYRSLAAVVSKFERNGTNADKAMLCVLRMEGMQRGAATGQDGTACEGAARSATPTSNTGVNEGRTWLLGSGL